MGDSRGTMALYICFLLVASALCVLVSLETDPDLDSRGCIGHKSHLLAGPAEAEAAWCSHVARHELVQTCKVDGSALRQRLDHLLIALQVTRDAEWSGSSPVFVTL